MKREIKDIKQAHVCEECKRRGVTTLATHSTTDAHEVRPGEFVETPPRYGCTQHPVIPMVYTLAGECMPFVTFKEA